MDDSSYVIIDGKTIILKDKLFIGRGITGTEKENYIYVVRPLLNN